MIREILTFGLWGDYNVVRRLAMKSRCFLPLYKLYEAFHCAFLPLGNTIDGDVFFPHGVKGCFFSTTCHIGKGCTIMQHVTIGSNYVNNNKMEVGGNYGAPHIGDNVFIGAGAKIIGPVNVGDGARIGAGSIVVEDVPEGATVVMNKPRIIISKKAQ